MFIQQYEPTVISPLSTEDLEAYLDDDSRSHTQAIFFKEKLDPGNGWAVPFVTKHKYHIHWGIGLDFEQMMVYISERWEENDEKIIFHTNYTDVREAFNFTNMATGEQIRVDGMLTVSENDLESGDHY